MAKTRATRARRTLESSYLTSVRNSVVVLGGCFGDGGGEGGGEGNGEGDSEERGM